jgi:hypothetical protein
MATAGGAAQRQEKARRGGLAGLLFGLVLGALGAIFLPRLAGPYMPAALRGEEVTVSGVVQSKSAEPERLLLTVASESGAMLVTFKKKVAEIDQLVSVGDSVQLTVDEYAPFVENARISRVMKRGDWHPAAAAAGAGDTTVPPDAGKALPSDVRTRDGDTTAPGTPESAMDTNDTMNVQRMEPTEAGDSVPSTTTP